VRYREAPARYGFIRHSSADYIMPDIAEGPSKYTNFVFDHFGPNITTEDNCSRKAIKSFLVYQPCTE